MIKIYRSTDNELNETQLFNINSSNIDILSEKNTWIHLETPTEEEVEILAKTFQIPDEHIKSALDEEEKARLEIDDDLTLIIIDVPKQDEQNDFAFSTSPLGIILLKHNIITISTERFQLIQDFSNGKTKNFSPHKKIRFILQILFRNATYFNIYLREIGRISEDIENRLKINFGNSKWSFKNHELLLLLELEKSLVYFSTSLRSNEVVINKIARTENVKKYEEDLELLEDILIEIKQALEMASIYKSILGSTRDAFSTIMSNNLNIVMKKLTSITMLFAIPTLISGLWGMNVGGIPFGSNPIGFFMALLVAIVCGAIVTVILFKNDLF